MHVGGRQYGERKRLYTLPGRSKTGLWEGSGGVNRGKLAVVAMIVLAIVLAAFALWWNIISGRRTLEFWGKDAAARIIDDSARVELLWLEMAAGDGDEKHLKLGLRTYAVTAEADVTSARGLIHARHALVEDASFDWVADSTKGGADYTLLVRFRDQAGATTVAFDFERGIIAHVEGGRRQKAAAKIMEGWQEFASRHRPASRIESPPGR